MIDGKNSYNWPKIGNEKAITFLTNVLDSGNLASSYIFAGPGNLGKSTIALSFASNLQGSDSNLSTDLHILERSLEEKTISIESVREFIKTLSLGSFSNSYKIGIIKEADFLTEEAKSALLKTLEEPKDMVLIILLVEDLSKLPATIISRSQVLNFQAVSSDVIYDYLIKNYNTSRSQAKDLANLSLGRPLRAIAYLEEPDKYKEHLNKAGLFLDIYLEKSTSSRLEILDQLFKDKTWSKDARELAESLIFLAEGLARDLLLLSSGQSNLIQHLPLADKITELRDSIGSNADSSIKALTWLKNLDQARQYLKANVNPRLVLEQVIINC